MASKQNPKYTCVLVTADGAKYDLSNVLLEIETTVGKTRLAACARVKCFNIKTDNGLLRGIVSVRDRLFLYADDGEQAAEVFRGFVWAINYTSRTEKELTLTCYDNLIYFQQSEDNRYFPKGRSTKSICQALCESWGIQLDYTYDSITHDKMPLKGSLSDIFLSDLLDAVKKKTGRRYVMRSVGDVIKIAPVAENSTVYTLKRLENVISTASETSMDDVVTKIIILGKSDSNGRSKIEATVKGDTAKYGTLQKIQNKDENTSLADAKREAETTIKEKGHPMVSYEVSAIDIPWLAPGDKVNVAAGDMVASFLVTGISRSITDTKKIMQVTLEDLS